MFEKYVNILEFFKTGKLKMHTSCPKEVEVSGAEDYPGCNGIYIRNIVKKETPPKAWMAYFRKKPGCDGAAQDAEAKTKWEGDISSECYYKHSNESNGAIICYS